MPFTKFKTFLTKCVVVFVIALMLTRFVLNVSFFLAFNSDTLLLNTLTVQYVYSRLVFEKWSITGALGLDLAENWYVVIIFCFVLTVLALITSYYTLSPLYRAFKANLIKLPEEWSQAYHISLFALLAQSISRVSALIGVNWLVDPKLSVLIFLFAFVLLLGLAYLFYWCNVRRLLVLSICKFSLILLALAAMLVNWFYIFCVMVHLNCLPPLEFYVYCSKLYTTGTELFLISFPSILVIFTCIVVYFIALVFGFGLFFFSTLGMSMGFGFISFCFESGNVIFAQEDGDDIIAPLLGPITASPEGSRSSGQEISEIGESEFGDYASFIPGELNSSTDSSIHSVPETDYWTGPPSDNVTPSAAYSEALNQINTLIPKEQQNELGETLTRVFKATVDTTNTSKLPGVVESLQDLTNCPALKGLVSARFPRSDELTIEERLQALYGPNSPVFRQPQLRSEIVCLELGTNAIIAGLQNFISVNFTSKEQHGLRFLTNKDTTYSLNSDKSAIQLNFTGENPVIDAAIQYLIDDGEPWGFGKLAFRNARTPLGAAAALGNNNKGGESLFDPLPPRSMWGADNHYVFYKLLPNGTCLVQILTSQFATPIWQTAEWKKITYFAW